MDSILLEKLHEEELGILCDVDAYCRQYGIQYSLYAGTMLGAVRHGGFIPWDDDIDICMTRCEYMKFCSMIQRIPMPGYYFQNFEVDDTCAVCHGKIRKNGTILLMAGEDERGHHGIWIDIFPLDKVPKDDSLAEEVLKRGKTTVFLTRALVTRRSDNLKKKSIRFLINLLPFQLRRKRLIRALKWIEEHDAKVTKDYDWVSMSSLGQMKIRFPESMIEGYVEMKFENQTFMAFRNYEDMLVTQYGDYMRLPPLEQQVCKHNPVVLELSCKNG